jgi:DNA-binding transcriptional regulator YdaS (Cro superfamily)
MDHKAILNAIADYKVIAARLGVHPSSVSRWKRDGIPPEYWPAISRMARAKHLRGITLELIQAGSPTYAGHREEEQPQPVS